MLILFGLLVPLLGTTLGATGVFFLKSLQRTGETLLLGFAAGIMAAASVWSLLLPAMEYTAALRSPLLPVSVGFLSGFVLLALLDRVLPEQEMSGGGRSSLLFFAITLHNIPEGMAVGAVLAALCADSIAAPAAIALAAGIAIQNIPEGAIVSMPLAALGMKRQRAFALGVASGATEPLAALVMLALTGLMQPLLPWCLSFAAGAMLFVVARQLLPAVGSDRKPFGTFCFALGFWLMMCLDVALG